jgi:hypothetical protein
MESQDKATADETTSLNKTLPDAVKSTVKANPDEVTSLNKKAPVSAECQEANGADIMQEVHPVPETNPSTPIANEEEPGIAKESNIPQVAMDTLSGEKELDVGEETSELKIQQLSLPIVDKDVDVVKLKLPDKGSVDDKAATSTVESLQSPTLTTKKRSEEEEMDRTTLEPPNKLSTTGVAEDSVITISRPTAKNPVQLFEQSNVPWQATLQNQWISLPSHKN